MSEVFERIAIGCMLICLTAASCTKHREEKPVLNLYVMSHCPFGMRAEDSILGLIGNFGSELRLRVSYIVSKSGENAFTSLHGPSELDEDLRQIAVQELYGSKFYSYLSCFNSSMNSGLCLKNDGIDQSGIDAFIRSGKAKKILDGDFAATEKLGINASPTLYIGSHRYSGPIQPERIIRAVCSSITGLSYCKALKPPVNVDITVLTGGWEGVYHPDVLKEGLDNFFYKAAVDFVDADSPRGKELAKRFGLTRVPAMIFSGTVAETPMFDMFRGRLKKVNGDYVDYMNDMGYRHFIDRPAESGEMIMLMDVSSKAAINACISILRLLRDYKKYQYRPDVRVIANAGGGISDEVVKAAAIIEGHEKSSLDDRISLLIKLYTDASLAEFDRTFPVMRGKERAARKEIAKNNALASMLGTGGARFAVLIDNTELIDPAISDRSIDIFELSPIIGKQPLTTGPRPAGQCAK